MIRAAVSEHGGFEVDTQGDALFAAFPRASDAVAAALQPQAELASSPVLVRMGIHTGEPILAPKATSASTSTARPESAPPATAARYSSRRRRAT